MKDHELSEANKQFRNKNYNEADKLYKKIKLEYPELEKIITSNILIINKIKNRKDVNKKNIKEEEKSETLDLETIKNSGLFDSTYYSQKYPHLRNVDIVKHYVEYGWKEGLNPSTEFNTKYYNFIYVKVLDKKNILLNNLIININISHKSNPKSYIFVKKKNVN